MTTFTTLLIDPFDRSIRAVEYDGRLETAYAMTKCDCITAAYIENGDAFYVDDEGLLKDPDEQAYFVVLSEDGQEVMHFLAGRGLLVGCDDQGETMRPSIDLFDIVERIRFVNNKEIARQTVDQLLSQSFKVTFQ